MDNGQLFLVGVEEGEGAGFASIGVLVRVYRAKGQIAILRRTGKMYA